MDRPLRAPEDRWRCPMLGVQREQVALGDEMVESVIESVLCFQLSMQIQSSLIVIGASDDMNVHSVRESGSRLSGSSPPLTWPDARSRPTHSRISPRLNPRVIRGLIRGLHAPSLCAPVSPDGLRPRQEEPRVCREAREAWEPITRRRRHRDRDRRRVDQVEVHTLRHRTQYGTRACTRPVPSSK